MLLASQVEPGAIVPRGCAHAHSRRKRGGKGEQLAVWFPILEVGKALASICTIVNPLPNCAIDFTAADGTPVSRSMGMQQKWSDPDRWPDFFCLKYQMRNLLEFFSSGECSSEHFNHNDDHTVGIELRTKALWDLGVVADETVPKSVSWISCAIGRKPDARRDPSALDNFECKQTTLKNFSGWVIKSLIGDAGLY